MSFIHPDRLPRTGNGIIDLWHRRMAQKINLAYDLWKQRSPVGDVAKAMTEFFDEAARHFIQEESIVRGAGYEDWRRHVIQHKAIKGKLDALAEKLRAADAIGSDVLDAFAYIDNLLYDHEFLEDNEFWKVFSENTQVAPGQSLLPWTEAYSVGDAELDGQHRDMIARLNDLYRVLDENVEIEAVIAALKGVRDHAASHFLREEGYMRARGLDAHGEHRDTHDLLLDDLDQMIGECAGCSPDLLRSMVAYYLRFWLLDHIVNADREIRRHNRGIVKGA